MEPPSHVLAVIADGKQLLHEDKGRKTAKTHPESTFGWVLSGWARRRSLKLTEVCTVVFAETIAKLIRPE